MHIHFSHHALERKTTRADYLFPSSKYIDNKNKIPLLRNILSSKGKWYIRHDKDGITRYYCILNNLEVYCGILIDSPDPYILITTYYPYTGKVKRKLFPRGKESYERYNFNITGLTNK